MALVLGLTKGQGFTIDGGLDFVVSGIHGVSGFTLTCHQSGTVYEVTETKAVEVYPEVFVSAGDRQTSSVARVAIDAPRKLYIARSYEKET